MITNNDNKIRRVAAYCRVSTDSIDQMNSLESQQRFFNEYIARNPCWELYHIYVDEGITGTNTFKRDSFNCMVQDGKSGKYDTIITKEVSRFARNLLDSIAYTRELRGFGIRLIFLNDNIDTDQPDYEFRLAIMASVAQEESRKTSERCKWGQRRMMEQGVVFGRDMLGYDVRGGKLYINNTGAQTVRRIFHMYLEEGKGVHVIARELRESGVKTSRFMKDWSYTVIRRILKNEKYCGDLVQQKTYTPDYLSHEKKRNRGELDYVVLRDHHEPIISREMFDAVQKELERRKKLSKAKTSYSSRYALSGKIVCGECGAGFTHTVRRRGSDHKPYENWSCVTKLHYGTKRKDSQGELMGCGSVNIRYDDLKTILMHLIGEVMSERHDVTEQLFAVVSDVLRTSDQNDRITYLEKELGMVEQKKEKLLDMCLSEDIDTSEYKKSFRRLRSEYEDLQNKLEREKAKCLGRPDQQKTLQRIDTHIKGLTSGAEWDEVFFRTIVDRIEVHNDRSVNIRFNQLDRTCCVAILKGKKEINAHPALFEQTR